MQKLYQFDILELQVTQITIIARIGYLSGVHVYFCFYTNA